MCAAALSCQPLTSWHSRSVSLLCCRDSVQMCEQPPSLAANIPALCGCMICLQDFTQMWEQLLSESMDLVLKTQDTSVRGGSVLPTSHLLTFPLYEPMCWKDSVTSKCVSSLSALHPAFLHFCGCMICMICLRDTDAEAAAACVGGPGARTRSSVLPTSPPLTLPLCQPTEQEGFCPSM